MAGPLCTFQNQEEEEKRQTRKPVSDASHSRLSWVSHEEGASCVEAGENQITWETSVRKGSSPLQSFPGLHSWGSIAIAEFRKEGKPGKEEVPS